MLYEITKGVNKEPKRTHDHKSDEERMGERGEREGIGGDFVPNSKLYEM